MSMASSNEKFLFIGNPGSGKSTLINCAVGKVVFKSGLSYGSGCTEFFQHYKHDGRVYMDTPGLADTRMMDRAAQEIKKALTQSGRYHLFFFVRLTSGRVDKNDINTIQRVLAALMTEKSNIRYSIIVNMVKKKQYSTLMEGGDAFKAVVACLNTSGFDTDSIMFIPEIPELQEQDNATTKLPDSVHFFIGASPSMDIDPNDVDDIITEPKATLRQLRVLEEVIETMRQDRSAMITRYEQLERRAARMEEETLKRFQMYDTEQARRMQKDAEWHQSVMEENYRRWQMQPAPSNNQDNGIVELVGHLILVILFPFFGF